MLPKSSGCLCCTVQIQITSIHCGQSYTFCTHAPIPPDLVITTSVQYRLRLLEYSLLQLGVTKPEITHGFGISILAEDAEHHLVFCNLGIWVPICRLGSVKTQFIQVRNVMLVALNAPGHPSHSVMHAPLFPNLQGQAHKSTSNSQRMLRPDRPLQKEMQWLQSLLHRFAQAVTSRKPPLRSKLRLLP